jgi:hypothetical protein
MIVAKGDECASMSETKRSDSNADPEPAVSQEIELAPADAVDPVIEVYKKDVDRTLLRENLKLTPEERAVKFLAFAKFVSGLKEAGVRARAADPSWGLK